VAEREHLRSRHVLDEVGELLQVALVAERDAKRVVGLLLDVVDVRAVLAEPLLDDVLVARDPVRELEVPWVVRVGELVAHDEAAVVRPVQRVPRGVGTAVLHRLEHQRHVAADVACAVRVDDPGDPAHR
jgi:hypothetical protein